MFINSIIQTNRFHRIIHNIIIHRNNTQYKNVHQFDTKETNIDQFVEQMAFTDDLILQPESVTQTTQADYTVNIKANDDQHSDKKSKSGKKNIVTFGDTLIKHVNMSCKHINSLRNKIEF